MCEYCSLNKDFWNQVVDRGQHIRILTPEESAAVETRQQGGRMHSDIELECPTRNTDDPEARRATSGG